MGVLDVVSPELSDFREDYSAIHKFETIDYQLFHRRETKDTLERHFASIHCNSRFA